MLRSNGTDHMMPWLMKPKVSMYSSNKDTISASEIQWIMMQSTVLKDFKTFYLLENDC